VLSTEKTRGLETSPSAGSNRAKRPVLAVTVEWARERWRVLDLTERKVPKSKVLSIKVRLSKVT